MTEFRIALNDEEEGLLRQIKFESHDHEDLRRSTRAAKPLTLSLLKRGAVPQVRLDWMMDPELNVGLGRSRFDVFRNNGTSGENIFEHGNFLKYLKYWIYGPDLPEAAIASIRDALDCIDTEGGRRDRARMAARAAARSYRLDPKRAGDEFFKLILEMGGDADLGRSVREAARQVRR